ncbi:hypothetical protein EV586_101697 [Tumebacillus sp. BK434]|uniref:hypothetical protein n=1 Tax=Tumebacillus sp. BK434 TaxID=2512169 RepID=UPI0010E4CDDA|nr:hypothetical protein [Tumebacillus sp. BK434]TCP59478.1 hypothetical protein EV586_101697 [Tumebacillus sp. BK434]
MRKGFFTALSILLAGSLVAGCGGDAQRNPGDTGSGGGARGGGGTSSGTSGSSH